MKKNFFFVSFRLYRDNIKQILALKKFINNKLELDSVYLDSTFLTLDYTYFPTQRNSINIIIKIIEQWLNENHENIVILRPPANYGYEFVLTQISKYFNEKIHVSNESAKDYLFIPELDAHVSSDIKSTGRIHLCSSGNSSDKWHAKKCMCLPQIDEKNICIVRPTAMKWKKLNVNDECYERHINIDNCYFVCYSNHSSYDEIKHFIQYLRPKNVRLNVIPSEMIQRNNMFNALDEIINEYQPKLVASSSNDTFKHPDVSIDNGYSFDKILMSMRKKLKNNKSDSELKDQAEKRRRCNGSCETK